VILVENNNERNGPRTALSGVMTRGQLALLSLVFPASSLSATAAADCPSVHSLPAYSHNDYANPRPLIDALALGYRGVEVDLYLAGSELVAAHERRSVRRNRTLESLYLRPLERLIEQCGKAWLGSQPFLLNIELKEASRAAYHRLLETLRRYPALFSPRNLATPPVEVVLVGWHPGTGRLADKLPGYIRLQEHVTSPRRSPAHSTTDSLVRLISLNYGKTIRWNGQRSPPTSLGNWLAAARRARDMGPRRLIRVFNVPVDTAVYRRLLEGGVDLVGVKDLHRGRKTLLQVTG